MHDIDLYRILCSELDVHMDLSKKSDVCIAEARKLLLLCIEEAKSRTAWLDFIQSMWALGMPESDVQFLKEQYFDFAHYLSADSLACEESVRLWYQLLSFRLKVRTHVTTTKDETSYLSRFFKTEETCKTWMVDRRNPVSRLARTITRKTLVRFGFDCDSIHGLGRHGPGAVLGGERLADKNAFDSIPSDLYLSYGEEFFLANLGYVADNARRSTYNKGPRHVISRLTLVPKDWKGPRGVFVSPKEAVFVQLAQDARFREIADATWFGDCWDYSNQAPSQELAAIGSATRMWDTLDLSDASDRIPLSLVSWLFHRADYLSLARSRPSYVLLPNSRKPYKLSMFAPMGDGKTFSALTWIVAVLTMAALLEQDGWNVTVAPDNETLRRYAKKFRVFGDDIAVEHKYFNAVVRALEAHNLVINKSKSFSNGLFRESCGVDAFNGRDITPVRLRNSLDREFSLLQGCSLHNKLFRRGYLRSAAYVRCVIEQRYPFVGLTSNEQEHPHCLVTYYPLEEVLGTPALKTRYNVWTSSVEQRCSAPPKPREWLSNPDSWWDLNYWLMTNFDRTERRYHKDDYDEDPQAPITEVLRKEFVDDGQLKLEGLDSFEELCTKQQIVLGRPVSTRKGIDMRSMNWTGVGFSNDPNDRPLQVLTRKAITGSPITTNEYRKIIGLKPIKAVTDDKDDMRVRMSWTKVE